MTETASKIGEATFDISDISSETWREYVYPEGGLYRINNPKELYRKFSNPNSHRVIDHNGVTHYPMPGWLALRWKSPSNPVSF